MEYVGTKLKEQDLKYEIENLKRKIEIADMPYRQAVKWLKTRGIEVAPLELEEK
jgi:hypothetical protein